MKSQLMSFDDNSLSRVPAEGKRSLFSVTMVRVGGVACLPVMMLGASFATGLTFWEGVIAVFFGSLILQFIAWGIGYAAAKEGLSTSLLSRWMGFGRIGSAIISLAITLSLFGWFGIQNTVFAQGLFQSTGILSMPIWSAITGLVILVIVVFGFKWLSNTAYIALPLFIIVTLYAFIHMLIGVNFSELIAAPPLGTPLSMMAAITITSGVFMTGAVMGPDMTRYLKSAKEVFWTCLISVVVGEFGFLLMGLLMAHAVHSPDILTVYSTLAGWVGIAAVILSTVKINDINLYSSSLGITNFLDTAFKVKLSRVIVTIVAGVIGVLLSMFGILNAFQDFLQLLSIALIPIGGIMLVDYFILKRHRKDLDESRALGKLPEKTEIWNPIAIISWAGGIAVGVLVSAGLPAVNALVAAGLIYFIAFKIFSRRGMTLRFKEEKSLE
ncbi:MAG: cytosine permease [Syntrophales bacterium]|nr:cytosine permease [Syntrophales bacterium]